MKKFLKDRAEVGKDIWLGFVWLVEFAYELGEIIDDKVKKNNKVIVSKTMPATSKVIENCIKEG